MLIFFTQLKELIRGLIIFFKLRNSICSAIHNVLFVNNLPSNVCACVFTNYCMGHVLISKAPFFKKKNHMLAFA